MDLFRFIFLLFFLFLSPNIHADTTDNTNTGIVFIHGTNDHRKDADGNYWKTDFTQGLAQALPNPENYLVVACDFSHYMWHEEAAGCVANQILDFAKSKQITSLTIYTHSNGSNAMRWILSNPTYDPRYLELTSYIKKVVAISPSSLGTTLADETFYGGVFEAGLSWLLGYRNDSVKMQRVGDMHIFNEHLLFGTASRPSLAIPFKVIVSSDVTASPLSSASYCNGYLLNTALKVTKIYLDKCSDGFLNCSSQQAAGDVWFMDVEKTQDQTPLSHNQSRHSCFGLGDILFNDLIDHGALS